MRGQRYSLVDATKAVNQLEYEGTVIDTTTSGYVIVSYSRQEVSVFDIPLSLVHGRMKAEAKEDGRGFASAEVYARSNCIFQRSINSRRILRFPYQTIYLQAYRLSRFDIHFLQPNEV